MYPHAGDWRAAQTVRRAAEYSVPLLAAFEPEHKGTLGKEVSFASAEPGNVELTWLKRVEDTDDWVLRLVEWHGVPAEAEVTVACRVAGARRANLLKDTGEPVAAEGKKLHLIPTSLRNRYAACGVRTMRSSRMSRGFKAVLFSLTIAAALFLPACAGSGDSGRPQVGVTLLTEAHVFYQDLKRPIDAIFGSNDDCALGALAAIQAAGRADIVVLGYDATPEARTAITGGTQLIGDAVPVSLVTQDSLVAR